MTRFVVDASVILTWCFPDEQARKAEDIAGMIAEGRTLVVPAFWAHEILNALLVGERRKRLTRQLTDAFVRDLSVLPVEMDSPADAGTDFGATQDLSRKHRLSAYDAAYLELALREGVALATLDSDLSRAASAERVPLL